jgi:hypothetical protein
MGMYRRPELGRIACCALALYGAALQPAAAASALPGAVMTWHWALPFLGILLSIVTGSLLFPEIWQSHYAKRTCEHPRVGGVRP